MAPEHGICNPSCAQVTGNSVQQPFMRRDLIICLPLSIVQCPLFWIWERFLFLDLIGFRHEKVSCGLQSMYYLALLFVWTDGGCREVCWPHLLAFYFCVVCRARWPADSVINFSVLSVSAAEYWVLDKKVTCLTLPVVSNCLFIKRIPVFSGCMRMAALNSSWEGCVSFLPKITAGHSELCIRTYMF